METSSVITEKPCIERQKQTSLDKKVEKPE